MIHALIVIILLFALIVSGISVVVALTSTVMLYILFTAGWTLAFPQQIIGGMNGFILLALPLFILAGNVMNGGGLSARLFEFARAVVGPLRGGLAQVNVLTSMFFGGMIGTSVADLAGVGSVVIPEMKKNGYPADFSVALTASSSGIGPVIPPSSPMILYSAITGTSLGAMFLAGIIPGILLGIMMMAIVWFLSKKNGWGAYDDFSWSQVGRTLRRALLAFGMPAIVVGGLVFGVFTPTEAGAFAVAYAILVSVFVYRTVNWRSLYRLSVSSAALTGEVMLIVGVSVALGRFLAGARVPEALAKLVDIIAIGDFVILKVASMLLLALVAGMILDPLIPIILPIILPTLLLLDINLVQFGILMVLAVVIGQVTPPLAIALIVAGKIGKVDFYDALKANTPFLIGMIVFLVLLMVFPGIITWLPEHVG